MPCMVPAPRAGASDLLSEVIELPVERVYAHHNELQTYRLRRTRAVGKSKPFGPPAASNRRFPTARLVF